MTPPAPPRTPEVLARAFGPLERRILEAIWREARPVTVRDLQPSFPCVAYTTLMTTLDRLYRKGVLERAKASRAYAYEPRFERSEMEARLAARVIDDLLGPAGGPRTLEPVLSCFVDAVSELDRQALDDLERLVKAKRSRLLRGESR
jgi:predicted transcriptional regulator